MPGIVLFRRRWGFGSDDLVFPGVVEIIFRTLWLVVVTTVYIHHQHGFNCATGYLLAKIYQVIIAVLVLHILSAISVVWCSTRGTIMDTSARRAAPLLLYIKLFLVIPELAWIIISSYWAFQLHVDCSFDAVLTVKATIFIDICVAVVVGIGTAILFDPVGQLRHDESRSRSLLTQKSSKVWERRIRLLFCCYPGDERSKIAFKNIAQHITVLFKGIDVVPTDIAAGLLLLYHHEESQRRDRRASLNAVIVTKSGTAPVGTESGATSDAVSPVEDAALAAVRDDADWTRISLLVHYMKFAMASYGWPLYCMMHLRKGCCQMFGCCRCCCHQEAAVTEDDNCFQSNTRAILKFTSLRREDILYANFQNTVFEVPFFVALDHREKTVVIAVRGTMSVSDILTDLTSDTESLEAVLDGDGRPCKGHKGMAQAAQNLVNKLQQLGTLTESFQKYPDYHLVITGHSLGAGIATILALLLREEYPGLKCYAFSPAAALNHPIVEGLDDLICSVVLGEDLVARLSVLTMHHLRDKVSQQLREAQQPKYKILASGLWYVLCGLPCALERSFFRREDTVSDTSSTAPLLTENRMRNYSAFDSTTDEEDDECDLPTCPLYPPGKIFHITNYSRSGNEEVRYRWARPCDFTEIIVHPMMLLDHLPDVVYRALRKIESQTCDVDSTESC